MAVEKSSDHHLRIGVAIYDLNAGTVKTIQPDGIAQEHSFDVITLAVEKEQP